MGRKSSGSFEEVSELDVVFWVVPLGIDNSTVGGREGIPRAGRCFPFRPIRESVSGNGDGRDFWILVFAPPVFDGIEREVGVDAPIRVAGNDGGVWLKSV